jgi:hypothetical protein
MVLHESVLLPCLLPGRFFATGFFIGFRVLGPKGDLPAVAFLAGFFLATVFFMSFFAAFFVTVKPPIN